MYIIDRMAIESSPSAFCTTAGRLVMVPVPRMATVGCATIGVSNSAPPDPVLVIVNVAPDRSSGPRSLLLAREPRSPTCRARPARFRSPAFLMTGTISPRSVSAAMPMFSTAGYLTISPSISAVVQNAEGDDSIAIRSMMYIFLSYDHRLIDGADAARFLSYMKKRLEAGDFESDLGL